MSTKHNTLVHFKDASFKYGVFDVLKHINLSIVAGDRVAVVGVNGSGKSTLLKYIAQKQDTDLELVSGTVEIQKDIKIKYVPQVTSEEISDQLSGGEKTKKILAQVFKTIHAETNNEKVLYVFDEPTNNLDREGLDWLLSGIQQLPKQATLLVVSHDREFLDTVATKIFGIDEYSRNIMTYSCSYSEYREMKKKQIENQWKDFDAKNEELKRLEKDTLRKVEWQGKIERTRFNNRKLDPHEKEKPPAAYLRDKEGKMGIRVKVARDRALRFDQETAIEKPKTRLPINLSFDNFERSGEKVIVCDSVVFSYQPIQVNNQSRNQSHQQIQSDNQLEKQSDHIGPFTFEIKYGEKVHVIGKNGSGKTTLIKGILSDLQPTAGKISLGSQVRIGYLPQEEVLRAYGEHKDIVDVVCAIFNVHRDNQSEGNFRMTLKRFGFDDSDARKHILDLSSGERSRLQLACMYIMKPNCIILDEPTNHLDIEAVEALEKALKEFTGTVLIASHDNRFINQIGITRTIQL